MGGGGRTDPGERQERDQPDRDRGRLARDWAQSTTRSTADGFADMLYTNPDSDRGVSHAQVSLAWLRTSPVVVAPLVGASKPSHIDDAVASLDIELSAEEVARLERPYTPRYDFQGISDDAELNRIMARLPGFTSSGKQLTYWGSSVNHVTHRGSLDQPACVGASIGAFHSAPAAASRSR